MDRISASAPLSWLWDQVTRKPKEGIGDATMKTFEESTKDFFLQGSEFYLAINFKDFFVQLKSSDLVYSGIIMALVIVIVFLWLDYQRVKRRAKRLKKDSGNQRKISDIIANPGAAIPEVKEHLQDTIKEVAEFVVPTRQQRFRKRDRVYFHGRRFMRTISDNVGSLARVSSDAKMRKKAINRIAKKFLNQEYHDSEDGSSDAMGSFAVGPAEEYLESDEEGGLFGDEGPRWIPPELSTLLDSFHMFGHHFDKSDFIELTEHIETLPIPSGQYLFKVGDPDEYVHVVKSGRMNVHILEDDNRTNTIKIVNAGETVTSLLSFIDVLTGYPNPFKTVCCRAMKDSIVIRIPASAFSNIFEHNPDMLIRVIQLSMARLQRVTFIALHQYLGLTSELIRHVSDTPHDPQSPDSMSLALALGDSELHNMHSTDEALPSVSASQNFFFAVERRVQCVRSLNVGSGERISVGTWFGTRRLSQRLHRDPHPEYRRRDNDGGFSQRCGSRLHPLRLPGALATWRSRQRSQQYPLLRFSGRMRGTARNVDGRGQLLQLCRQGPDKRGRHSNERHVLSNRVRDSRDGPQPLA